MYMNFKDWDNINPIKKDISELTLSESETKKLTPVLLSSTFLIEARKFYSEFTTRYKRYLTPEFSRKSFDLFYKKKYYVVVPFYSLEKELNYLISKVPEASVLLDDIKPVTKSKDILENSVKFFKYPLHRGFVEYNAVLNGEGLVGWKVREERP